MKKNKIMAIILSGAMIATMSGAIVHKNNNVNKIKRNNILLAQHNVSYIANACVINGNGSLVLTNKKGAIVSYLSVGEMLKVQSIEGNKSLVTVEETGAKGYIDNSNKLNINNGDINNVTRMNRNGYIINVSNTVNLRKGPGMDYTILDGLTDGTSIRITGKTGQWYRVSVNGKKGYIFEEYVGEGNTTQHTNNMNIDSNKQSNTLEPTSHSIIGSMSTNNMPSNNIEHTVSHTKVNNEVGSITRPNTNIPVVNPSNNTTINNNNNVTVNGNHTENTGSTVHTTPSTSPTTSGGKVVTPNGSGNGNTSTTPNTNPDHTKPATGGIINSNPTTKPANPTNTNNPTKSSTGGKTDVSGQTTGPNTNGPTVNPNAGSGSTTTPEHHDKPSVKPDGTSTTNSGNTPDHVHDGTVSGGGKVIPNPNAGSGSSTSNSNKPSTGDKGNTGSSTTNPAKPSSGTITDGSGNTSGHQTTSPTKPSNPTVVTPELTAHNVRLVLGKQFNTSMLGATSTTNGAVISYDASNVNVNKPGTYDVTVTATKDGVSTKVQVKVTVIDEAPSIEASSITITPGTEISAKSFDITATSVNGINLSNTATVNMSQVNINKAGKYPVTISVTDQYGETSTLTVYVTVSSTKTPDHNNGTGHGGLVSPTLSAPVITGNNYTAPYGSTFNVSDLGVKATVDGQPVQVSYKGTVDTNKPGTYKITAIATNSQGKTTEKTFTVTVPQAPTPFIHAQNITIANGTEYNNSMLNASATVGGKELPQSDISYSGNVDTSKAGTYDVTVTVNYDGNTYNNTFTVTVQEAQPVVQHGTLVVETMLPDGTIVQGSETTRTGDAGTEVSVNGPQLVEGYNLGYITVNGAKVNNAPNNIQLVGGHTTTIMYHLTKQAPLPAPVITGDNVSVAYGSTWNNSMLNAKTTEGTLTYEGSINTNQVGLQHIIATATANGQTTTKVFNVIVEAKPVKPVSPELGKATVTYQTQDGKIIVATTTVDNAKVGSTITNDSFTAPNGYHLVKILVNGKEVQSVNGLDISKETTNIVYVVAHNKIPTGSVLVDVLDQSGTQVVSPTTITGNENTSIDSDLSNIISHIPTSDKIVSIKYNGKDISMEQAKQLDFQAGENNSLTIRVKKPVVNKVTYDVNGNHIAGKNSFSKPVINSDGGSIIVPNSLLRGNEIQSITINGVQHKVTSVDGETVNFSGSVVESPTGTNIIVVNIIKKAVPATITANSITLEQGATFNDSMLHATTNESDVKLTYKGNVNTNEPGTYTVTITATNKAGEVSTKNVTVTVKKKEAPAPLPLPTIDGHDMTINVNSPFSDSMLGISATVEGANVPVHISGTVNNRKPGKYNVTVTATNTQGKSSTKTFVVTVSDTAPSLSVSNYTMKVGQTFSLSDLNIKATSAEGTNIASSAKIVSGSVDTSKAGTYRIGIQVTDQYGMATEQTATVTVSALTTPVINGQDITIQAGKTFNDSMINASATVNGVNVPITYEGTVNTNKPGTYKVKVLVNGIEGQYASATKTLTVTVTDEAPTLTASNYTMTQGQTFKLSDLNVNATSSRGANLTSSVKIVSGSVNTNTPGTYTLTLSVTDQYGVTTTKTVTVTVKAKPVLPAPVIEGNDVTITQGQSFSDSMLGASATVQGVNVPVTYSGTVNTQNPGTYQVTISAVNSQGLKASKVVTVTVKAKPVVPPVLTIANPVVNIMETNTQSLTPAQLEKLIGATATENATISYIGINQINTVFTGTYQVTVEATNAQGYTSASKTVTVNITPLVAPTLTLANPTVTLTQGQSFSDSMIGATANEGAQISYAGSVDTSTPGSYNIIVTATNDEGMTTTKDATVIIKQKPVDPSLWHWTNKEQGVGTYKGQTYYTQGPALENAIDQQIIKDINAFCQSMNGKTYTNDQGQTVTYHYVEWHQSQAAQYMAKWRQENCVQYHYRSHVDPNTDNPFHGLTTDTVFTPQANAQDGGQGVGGWVENLTGVSGNGSQDVYNATGVICASETDIEEVAARVTYEWVHSHPHMVNLLSGNTQIGVYGGFSLGTGDGQVGLGSGTVIMDGLTPPVVGGTFNPSTGMFTGGHIATFHFTTPNAAQAQAAGKEYGN